MLRPDANRQLEAVHVPGQGVPPGLQVIGVNMEARNCRRAAGFANTIPAQFHEGTGIMADAASCLFADHVNQFNALLLQSLLRAHWPHGTSC